MNSKGPTVNHFLADPLYRRLLNQWALLRGWRWFLLPAMLLILTLLLGGLPLLFDLTCFPTGEEVFPGAFPVLAGIYSLLLFQSLLAGLMPLLAAWLASQSFVAGDELLQLTPLPPRVLVRTRLLAVLRVLLPGLALLLIIRLGLARSIRQDSFEQFYSWRAALLSNPSCPNPWALPRPLALLGNESFQLFYSFFWRMELIHEKPIWPLWAITFAVQPLLDAVLCGALGIVIGGVSEDRNQVPLRALSAALGLLLLFYLGQRIGALGMTSFWALVLEGGFPVSIWLPPWDFGGGISPAGWAASVWTLGLPVVTPGFAETPLIFEILLPLGLVLQILLIRAALGLAIRRGIG